MQPNEEKELIRLAQKDPEVFAEIYSRYYRRIFEYALKRTADLQVAQDITSETFFKALRNLWKFRWRNIPFSSWLYRIATNEIRQYYRKRKHPAASLEELLESGFEPMSDGDPATDLMEAQEKLQQQADFLTCQRFISGLDLKYQEVLSLRFLERKGLKEIGEILGKSEGTIKSLLHRGLKKLRGEMTGGAETQPLSGPRIVEEGQCQTTETIEPS